MTVQSTLLRAFYSSRQSLRNAYRAIEHAETHLTVFVAANQPDYVIRPASPEGGWDHLLIMPAISDDMLDELKIAVDNLRSSLDQAVYGASAVLQGTEPNRSAAFIFGVDPDDYERRVQTLPRRAIHADLLPLLRSFKPWYGGPDDNHHLLRCFNDIANTTKHRSVLLTLIQSQEFVNALFNVRGGDFEMNVPFRSNPPELLIGRAAGQDTIINYDLINYYPSYSTDKLHKPEHAVKFLKKIHAMCTAITDQLEDFVRSELEAQ